MSTTGDGFRKVIQSLRKKRCGALACERKATERCASCGRPLCGAHAFLKYVDGNNASITKYAPIVCAGCHPENHRPRGVMDGTATEPNRREATPAPVL